MIYKNERNWWVYFQLTDFPLVQSRGENMGNPLCLHLMISFSLFNFTCLHHFSLLCLPVQINSKKREFLLSVGGFHRFFKALSKSKNLCLDFFEVKYVWNVFTLSYAKIDFTTPKSDICLSRSIRNGPCWKNHGTHSVKKQFSNISPCYYK